MSARMLMLTTLAMTQMLCTQYVMSVTIKIEWISK